MDNATINIVTIDRAQLSRMIPQGYKKIIAKRAGVSQQTVTWYFKGVTQRSLKVEKAIIEVLKELNQELYG